VKSSLKILVKTWKKKKVKSNSQGRIKLGLENLVISNGVVRKKRVNYTITQKKMPTMSKKRPKIKKKLKN